MMQERLGKKGLFAKLMRSRQISEDLKLLRHPRGFAFPGWSDR
jgi:hypothetical protein